jgi:ribonuclease P protein component
MVVGHLRSVAQKGVKAYQPNLSRWPKLNQPIEQTQLVPLKKRSEFLRVASTRLSQVTPGLILQCRKHTLKETQSCKSAALRLGFTVSKKVGNSVIRNRIKRRLRAAAQAVLPTKAVPHLDLVIIGRQNTFKRSFPDLLTDLEKALKKLQSHKGNT